MPVGASRPSPPLVLCSGTLGAAPWEAKVAAAAAAGFDGISIYGHDVRSAERRGVDGVAVVRDHGLFVAEVDGVVRSTQSDEGHAEALRLAAMLGARSITVVEAGEYDPADMTCVAHAVDNFRNLCDRAAALDLLVHIEPFAWSPLAHLADALAIVEQADRPNGGILLDLHHHVSGPDCGRLDPSIPIERIFEIQLADTRADPLPDRRDECMLHRQLPGQGSADLAARLRDLAGRGPLPPIGVEVFGEVVEPLEPDAAGVAAMAATLAVLEDAGLGAA